MNKTIKTTIILLFIILNTLFLYGVPLKDSVVSQKDIDSAGGYPRSKTYAVATNPLDNYRYEFMITREGYVIFKRGNDAWKYWGVQGFRLEEFESGKNKLEDNIYPAEMIAADGNKIFIKLKNSNEMFFSAIVKGTVDLDKGLGLDLPYTDGQYDPGKARNSTFFTIAPNNYSPLLPYDTYAEYIYDNLGGLERKMGLAVPMTNSKAAWLEASGIGSWNLIGDFFINLGINILCYFEKEITVPPIPYMWPVAEIPRFWYKIKADFYGNNGVSIIDIGLFDINRVEFAKYGNYYWWPSDAWYNFFKPFGGEFFRRYEGMLINKYNEPLGALTNTRDFGTFTDGTCNYYVLIKTNDGEYQIWTIDEQAFMCNNWWRFAERLEQECAPLDLFVNYDSTNWYSAEYDYRGAATIQRIICSFQDYISESSIRSFIPLPVGIMTYIKSKLNQYDTIAYQNTINSGIFDRDFFKPTWRQIKPSFEDKGKDDWLFTALEAIEKPNYNVLENINMLNTFFFNQNYWKYEFFNDYNLIADLADFWEPLPDFTEEPTLSVSKTNVIVASSKEIYSINWQWGSMDFKWRKRNMPAGAYGKNVMLLYEPVTYQGDKLISHQLRIWVPAIVEGVFGYQVQPLIPDYEGTPVWDNPNKIWMDSSDYNTQSWTFVPGLKIDGQPIFTSWKNDFIKLGGSTLTVIRGIIQ